MKKFACLLVLFSITAIAYPQYLDQYTQVLKTSQDQTISQLEDEYPIGRLAVTLHPLGFAQFGPMIGADVRLQDNLALSSHVRFPSYGLLASLVRYDDDDGERVDELSGYAFDAGLLYFFGEKISKPYAGAVVGYENVTCIYSQNTDWEWWQDESNPYVYMNAGYRFRHSSGLFINTGIYFGLTHSTWDWYFLDPTYGTGGNGITIHPDGMAEVAIGIEF